MKLKKGSKILIANDSLGITGVQTYVSKTAEHLEKMGYRVVRLEPNDNDFFTLPAYKDFNWTVFATPIVTRKLLQEKPDAILITTIEAPIGTATKNVCEFLEISRYCKSCPYTASYTTDHGMFVKKLLEQSLVGSISSRIDIAKKIENKVVDFSEAQFLRSKYYGAKKIMVNAQSSKEKLEKMKLKNVEISKRGIDAFQFHLPTKDDENPYEQYDWYREKKLPILIYLGRVAYEKDIQLFLEGDLPGYHRVVAGDGPAMEYLKSISKGKKNIHFVGKVDYSKVKNYFQYARVTFFPSSFDTFGQTIVESAACGTPVVGFNVQGPKDVIKRGVMGVIVPSGTSLFSGLSKALRINRKKCSRYTLKSFSWGKATMELLENLYPIKWRKGIA